MDKSDYFYSGHYRQRMRVVSRETVVEGDTNLMIIDHIASGCCMQIRIGNGSSFSGPRIGGTPPEGISSTRLSEAHYLLTLSLEEDDSVEVSLFLNQDWWDCFFDQLRIVFSADDPWIDFVIHGPSVRATNDYRRSLLTPHPINYGAIILDQQGYDEDNKIVPSSDHKLGGRPFFIKSEDDFVTAVEATEQRGYRQLLQLAFPGSEDANIAGDWPFADGIFNLFFKQEEGNYCWCYCWQF